MTKYLEEKKQLRAFLQARGISYNATKKTWRCPNGQGHNHGDMHESATLYENQEVPLLTCHVCGKSWNIFDLVELLDNVHDFPEMLKIVRTTLNMPHEDRKKNKPVPVIFPPEKKEEFQNKIREIAKEKSFGEIIGSWKYHDKDGNVIALDVRFENQGEKKTILTFWYDGKYLKYSGAPVLIYNLKETLDADKNIPRIIHEGAKKADAGKKKIPGFIHMGWSGGAGKAHLIDWSILADFKVFIFPDDDEPGLKAAGKIRKQLPKAIIINPPESARTIKPQGADIVEALQVMSTDELTAYILDPVNHSDVSDVVPALTPGTQPTDNEPPTQRPPAGSTSEPFKILGIGDDGKAAFITEEGRLMKWSLDSMSKSKLMVLCGRAYWHAEYPNKNGADYDTAIDDIIRIAQKKDFNESHIRGRGAWRDGDKISYHDGVETCGDWNDKITYLRLPRHDIGINDDTASPDICQKVKDTTFNLSFETKTDAVRCLGWAALAPFAGALKYRPSILITGPSGSGKSTIQEIILKNLTDFIWCDTKETSTAGIRSRIGKDSACVFFEEGDKTTDKMKMNVDDILSFVRSNYTSNSPDAYKGTKEGGWVNYKMNSMFGIASINPTIENIADENRIFRINMVPPQNNGEWKAIEKELMALLSEKNCRSIRALTWAKLKTILSLTEHIIDIIRELTHKDYRSSYADAMLASAFMVVWNGVDNPTDEQIINMLTKYYSYQPAEEHRNEAEEIIERLMDETIEILHEKEREKITIIECLDRIYKSEYPEDELPGLGGGKIQTYRECLARYGIRLVDDCNVAIVNSHHKVSEIIKIGKGYSKLLKRHPGCVDHNRVALFYGDKNRKCTVLRGLLKSKWDDKTDEEKLEVMFD